MAGPERRQASCAWPNGTALAATVLATALTHPERTAIVAGATKLTYAWLVTAVEDAAKLFRQAGVTPGEVICLHARRTVSLPVALLAAWRAGAVVALLDASLPKALLDRSEALIGAGWRIQLDAMPSPYTMPALTVTGRPRGRSTGSHILFTSGTTGSPAAVTVPAAALEAILAWYAGTFRPGPADRVTLLAGPGHDPVLRDILVPFGAGATLVVHPSEVFASPRALIRSLARTGTTVLHATPGLLEVILAGQASERTSLTQLRLIVSGGAPLTAGLARTLRAAFGPRPVLVNAYGATETPQIVACSILGADELPSADLPDDATLDIGRGVAGAELRLDKESGEIIVHSPHLALGYLPGTGQRRRFTEDPDSRPGYRAYRTGDRGEYVMADHADPRSARVRVLGRLDRQISFNGHRISPEEIEAAAARHPGVLRAHVSLRSGPSGDYLELAIAPTRPDAREPLQAKAFRRFLLELLPAYAVPTRIAAVDGFTLNHNHKLAITGRGSG